MTDNTSKLRAQAQTISELHEELHAANRRNETLQAQLMDVTKHNETLSSRESLVQHVEDLHHQRLQELLSDRKDGIQVINTLTQALKAQAEALGHKTKLVLAGVDPAKPGAEQSVWTIKTPPVWSQPETHNNQVLADLAKAEADQRNKVRDQELEIHHLQTHLKKVRGDNDRLAERLQEMGKEIDTKARDICLLTTSRDELQVRNDRQKQLLENLDATHGVQVAHLQAKITELEKLSNKRFNEIAEMKEKATELEMLGQAANERNDRQYEIIQEHKRDKESLSNYISTLKSKVDSLAKENQELATKRASAETYASDLYLLIDAFLNSRIFTDHLKQRFDALRKARGDRSTDLT